MSTSGAQVRNENFADMLEGLSGLRAEVYAELLRHGPCTTRELARAMGHDPLSIRPRVTELGEMGMARCVGRRGRDGVWAGVREPPRVAVGAGRVCGAEQMLLGL